MRSTRCRRRARTLTTGSSYTRKALTVTTHAITLIGWVMEQAGLRGSVGLGVRVNGIQGVVAEPRNGSSYARYSHYQDQPKYREDEYRETTIVTSAELAGRVSPIVDRLFGSLLRAMNYGDPLRPAAGDGYRP